MELKSLSDTQRQQIIEILASFKPSFVYLFGSAQRGELRPESDVDLAFYSAEPVDALRLLNTREQLASALSRDVDLIDLSASNDVIRAQVIGYGEPLIVDEPSLLCELQMRWLKQYAMLNHERAPILERIRREGRVYG